MNKTRILVLDDEEDLCEILQFNLEREGYLVDTALSAEEAMLLDLSVYNIFLLDVMMGKMSGFKFGDYLRKNESTQNKAIIFLTARDDENDKLTGFSVGADDYLAKPYSINELSARIKAILRRSKAQDHTENETQTKENIISFEELRLDLNQKTAKINNIKLSLTRKEFELLSLFLQQSNRIFSREELLKKIWKDEVYVLDRTIDVNITRLRKKIVPYDKNLITRHGYGYIFSTE